MYSKIHEHYCPNFMVSLNQMWKTIQLLGLYCVKTRGKHIRIVVMNNLLPRDVKMHWKYDLKGQDLRLIHFSTSILDKNLCILYKGSTLKRTASQKEREKKSPTFKDLDFRKSPNSVEIEFLVFLKPKKLSNC